MINRRMSGFCEIDNHQESVFYFISETGRDTCDIIDDFKDKRAYEHTFGWKEITAYRISCGDHTVCFNDHTDVSGVWK